MIENQCRNAKRELPSWLLAKRNSKPELAFGLDFYLNSFWDLCTERVFADVCLGLAWSKIQMYADYYELDFEEKQEFHYLIKRIDNAYVNKVREDARSREST